MTQSAGRTLKFEIFRYNPEDPASKPRMETFELDPNHRVWPEGSGAA